MSESNKRGLNDLSLSFAEAVKKPKKQREGSLNSSQTDVQPITSTPGSTVIAGLNGRTSPKDTPSSPGNAKHDAIQPHFITISSEDIHHIADAV